MASLGCEWERIPGTRIAWSRCDRGISVRRVNGWGSYVLYLYFLVCLVPIALSLLISAPREISLLMLFIFSPILALCLQQFLFVRRGPSQFVLDLSGLSFRTYKRRRIALAEIEEFKIESKRFGGSIPYKELRLIARLRDGETLVLAGAINVDLPIGLPPLAAALNEHLSQVADTPPSGFAAGG